MLKLVWLIPALPLAGFLFNFLLGRKLRLSERVVSLVACGVILGSLLLTLGAFYKYATDYAPSHDDRPYITSEAGGFPHSFTWLPGGAAHTTLGDRAGDFANFDIEWSYQIDQLSLVMMFIVTFVGFWIHVFAAGYMHGDTGYYRFFAYLNLFMFMMLLLVMGSNFMIMFIGWEGVGLCSYLLIGYYFDRKEAGDASKKAFVVNRIGDFGFALAIMGVFAVFGTLSFSQLAELSAAYPQEGLWQFGLMSWLALGLFIGATGKSAQIPLYIWLPDAMAGPTPVSALIHAATMVTAGVFMVTRTNFIFQRSVTMMMVVALVGCLTAFIAATIGITQTDIKKVLAYSTVSQLGYMFLGAGVGAFIGAIFHVFTHAFFKALLFLGSGSVIHGLHHEQEMPRMGGLAKYMPITYKTMLMGWLAICGIIPFAGFWSKDEILWKTYSAHLFGGEKMLWFVAFATAGITAFYMTRLMALTFWGEERFKKTPSHDAHDAHSAGHGEPDHGAVEPHESPPSMTRPLIVLAFFSVVGGLVGIPHALSFGVIPNYFERWLEPVIVRVTPAAEHHASLAEYVLIALSLAVAAFGILLGWLFYVKRTELAAIWARRLAPLYTLSANKWYLDWLLDVKGVEAAKMANDALWRVDATVVDGGVNGSAWFTRLWARITGFWDKWVIDLAVNATGWVVYAGSIVLRTFQTGYWQNYALVFTLALFIIVFIYQRPVIWGTLKGLISLARGSGGS
jgi:NADH-quinone oxidoreductase subunit L